jgi:hypothetical protein
MFLELLPSNIAPSVRETCKNAPIGVTDVFAENLEISFR